MQPPRTHKFLKLFLTIFLISGFSQITLAGDVLPLNVDNDGDGYTENQGDCNDANKQTFPDAPQLLSFVDNNCNPNDGNNPDPELDGVTFDFGQPAQFSFGDVEGDGLTDVVVSTFLPNGTKTVIIIYLGSSNKLIPGVTITQRDYDVAIVGAEVYLGSAKVFDYNQDGKGDIILNADYDGASLLVVDGRASFHSGMVLQIKNNLLSNNSKLTQYKLGLIKNAGDFIISPKDIDGNDHSVGDLVISHNGGYFIMSMTQAHMRGTQDLENNYFAGFSYEDKIFESIVTGDFNNDGYGDVAVGENQTLGMEYGQAWVIYGAASWQQLEGQVVQVNFLNQHGIDNLYFYGDGPLYQAAENMSAGDVDGDGFDDLLISVMWEDVFVNNEGCAWIIPGEGMEAIASGTQLALNGDTNEIRSMSICGIEGDTSFSGGGVLLASDTNGDGLNEINIATRNQAEQSLTFNGENLEAYASQRIFRTDANMATISQTVVSGDSYGGGDVDNDGTEDIIVTGTDIHYLLFGGYSN